MSAFAVGQRIRVTAHTTRHGQDVHGRSGKISFLGFRDDPKPGSPYYVRLDGFSCPDGTGITILAAREMEPAAAVENERTTTP